MNEMHYNLNRPQRQSVKGVVILFMDSLQKVVRAMWVPLLLIAYRLEGAKLLAFLGFLLIILFVIGIIAYVQYLNFTFYLDDKKQEFVIQKGVFSKSKIAIQLHKIQQININQSLVQKLVQVYSLDIDTAGSSKKEVSIRAIDHELAHYIKNELLEASDSSEVVADQVGQNQTQAFLKISPSTLFKVGLTSHYGRSLALLFGFIAAMYNGLSDFAEAMLIDDEQVEGMVSQGVAFISLGIIIGVLLLAVFIINLVRTFVKYYDLQMSHQKQSMLISFGLFAKKNTLLRPSKVQVTRFSQNFIQRKLNLLNLQLRQASSTDVTEDGKSGSLIEIPGCSADEKHKILTLLFDKTLQTTQAMAPNFRYVFKALVLGLMIPIGMFLLLSQLVWQALQSFYILIPLYIAFIGIIVFFKFKNYRLFIGDDFIIFRHGAWDVTHEIIEPYKLQGISTHQYFWHKKSDVGHVTFHTAAGDIAFKFANFTAIKKQMNVWLYKVESSAKHWM